MLKDEVRGALDFLRQAEKLKVVLRSSHTSGGRPESTAEHTWRLCLWAIAFADELGKIDLAKLLKICIVHDLGEAHSGDIPAVSQTAGTGKAIQERADLEALTSWTSTPHAVRRNPVALGGIRECVIAGGCVGERSR
jgi:putative hydrolase of HD superfamily